MSLLPWLLALPALVALTVWDLRCRRIPNWLSGTLLIAALVASASPWRALLGLVVGAALVGLAGYPGGDVKGAAVLGAFLGPSAIALVLAGAMAATLGAWWWGRTGVPFFLYMAPAFALAFVVRIGTG